MKRKEFINKNSKKSFLECFFRGTYILKQEVIYMWKKIKPYVISILIALGVGGLSGFLSREGMQIYQATAPKPPLSPPDIVFPIVWSILYILMGISSALVYVNREKNPTVAYEGLRAYALQLIMNFFWSIIFFNMQAYLFAFIWLLAMEIVIIYMIFKFRQVSPLAAYLQIPYAIWCVFALYLNFMTFIQN